jgi:hypothetical protein
LEQNFLKLSLDKGNKLKEGHGSLPRRRVFVYGGKKKRGK